MDRDSDESVQDLEDVEEWNEYGEIKDNLSFSTSNSIITPTPSATNTPSKAPPAPSAGTPLKTSTASIDTPSKSTSTTITSGSDFPSKSAPSTSGGDTPITLAMRQAGFEAAKKAGDAKTKARTDTVEAMKAKNPVLQKLDNSGPTGPPPPSGNTEAGDAIRGESGEANVEGKADDVSATEEAEVLEGKGLATVIPTSKEAEAAANESILEDKSHIVLAGHGQTPEGLTPSSEQSEADYEELKRVETGKSGLSQVMSATDKGEDLPGKRTQEQGAADGGEVGISVAD